MFCVHERRYIDGREHMSPLGTDPKIIYSFLGRDLTCAGIAEDPNLEFLIPPADIENKGPPENEVHVYKW